MIKYTVKFKEPGLASSYILEKVNNKLLSEDDILNAFWCDSFRLGFSDDFKTKPISFETIEDIWDVKIKETK